MSFFSEQSLLVDAQLSFAYQLIIIKELEEENCSLKTENQSTRGNSKAKRAAFFIKAPTLW